MNIQNTKTELNSTGEDLNNDSADADDPAPASLWIIMLTKRGRLWIETFQSWKKKKIIFVFHTSRGCEMCLEIKQELKHVVIQT